MNEKEIKSIQKVRKEMDKELVRFAKELAQKLNRTVSSIKEEGLTIKNFYFDLKISFVDGSKMKFNSAFFVENDVEYGPRCHN